MPDESEDGSVESIEEQEEGRDVLNVISNLETPGPSKRQRLNAPE